MVNTCAVDISEVNY